MKDSVFKKDWLIIAGLMLILTAGILVIIFFSREEARVTKEWSVTKSTETITCESNEVVYPIYKYNNTNNRFLKIITTFTNDALDNISLTYQLKYNDLALAEKSDAENQAAMNISFGADSLGAFAFDAKYSNVDGLFQMTLYAKSEKLDDRALKYFMLDGLDNGEVDAKTYTRDSILKVYSDRGLNCIHKEINNK